MRPIKFRAWINERVGMVEVDEIRFMPYHPNFIHYHWKNENGVTMEYSADHEEIELMQYTGLKDKNGREIYEGDIIKKNISIFTKLDPRPEVFYGEVKYYEGSFWIDNAKIEHAEPLFDEIDPIQVIGNIYEDKHLLEVQT